MNSNENSKCDASVYFWMFVKKKKKKFQVFRFLENFLVRVEYTSLQIFTIVPRRFDFKYSFVFLLAVFSIKRCSEFNNFFFFVKICPKLNYVLLKLLNCAVDEYYVSRPEGKEMIRFIFDYALAN